MLPDDVAVDDPMEADDLMVMQYVQVNSDQLKKHLAELKMAQKKANMLEGELKKANKNLDVIEKARDASDDVTARSMELGTLTEYLTWTATELDAVLPNPLETYTPMILPGFNEEDYKNQSEKEGVEGEDEVGDEGETNELGAVVEGSGVGGQDIPFKV
ncbi:hypothetical protein Acr_11g0006870 [Actinidia rufa]|uniref:Uncharacterized protein n=1 Tax=Actinidia rufa TaxID=165716 RepID=A0A7J0FCI0_9ERIC|nr:hypothetical protein Acr_11g0006870 [Actinidia rufa]